MVARVRPYDQLRIFGLKLKSGNNYGTNPKDIIIKASQERSSLRGLQRTFGAERHTISKWIKKKQINP